MKKSFSCLMKCSIVLMAILAIVTIPALPASAQTPVEETFTIGLTASAASTNYTSGFQTAVFSSFKPIMLEVVLYATNATVSVKRSAAGSAYYSYAMGTSTSAVLFLSSTNAFYFLRGDVPTISLGATNIGGTVKMQGLEQ